MFVDSPYSDNIDSFGDPETIFEPLDLLRLKWCSEPSVLGGRGRHRQSIKYAHFDSRCTPAFFDHSDLDQSMSFATTRDLARSGIRPQLEVKYLSLGNPTADYTND